MERIGEFIVFWCLLIIIKIERLALRFRRFLKKVRETRWKF
nr:MAG TPA: hypothetical protein [Caudoviricetes sp.]